jgi:hypothetical protein
VSAWKDLERRVCRALGAERRPSIGAKGWASGSDDDGSAPFAVETKRTVRYQLRTAWVEQARRNAKATARPWLLVVAEHGDRRPVAVLDFWAFVQLAEEAGRVGRAHNESERWKGDTMSTTDEPTPTEPQPDPPAPGPEPTEPKPDDEDGDEK